MESFKEKSYKLLLNEKEVHALEVILSSMDASKLVTDNKLALSMHNLKYSDIFLTVEKIQDFIKKHIKREDE
ncbi:MAG TPA: hypothetical protein ENI73_04090 [Spirochaetes bacterium]|nr:hypothetical protein [Spirochaetota bacterium]